MKKMFKNIAAALALALSIMVLFCACGEKGGPAPLAVASIAVTTDPARTEYSIGDTFSAEGGVITVTYSDNTTKTVQMTDDSVELSAPAMTASGEKTVTVTYENVTASFTITVVEQAAEGIEIIGLPAKTEYVTGQAFSADGGVVKVIYADGGEREISLSAEGVTVSSPDMTTEGDKTVTVTYGGKSASFTINVASAGEQKPVGRITLKTAPTKTDYIAGDAFDPEGGVLTVTYTDRTAEEIPLTDRRVSFEEIDMGTEDMTDSVQRTVTVNFGDRRTTFSIGISAIGGRITFDTKCDEVKDFVVKVAKGSYAAEPEALSRSGYTFYKWYEDEACTVEYEFTPSNIVNKNITVYAQWKEDGATYHNVTFDYNYYGEKRSSFTQITKSGDNARAIATPERDEFQFDGWFADEALTVPFDANAAVTSDMTLRAKWTKAKTASSQYIFEAEMTDLTGKTGPGYSGAQNDAGMIVQKPELSASGGAAVSYLYQKGNSLEFHIACSEDAAATLVVRMAAELDNIDLSQDNYKIYVNGESQAWAKNLVNGGNFEDITIGSIQLKEGYNIIRLVTDNSVNPMGAGNGTYAGTAPMIDCIKIDTTAVLTWDGNYNLPMNY